jgi:hypothetical protein
MQLDNSKKGEQKILHHQKMLTNAGFIGDFKVL